jgi:type 1 fimbria pilin
MKKNMLGLTIGTLCLVASIGAHATTAAELIVRGTIKPVACNLTLGGGGIVDYQIINPASLSATQFNPLAAKFVSLTVSCGQAPAKFGLKLSDMQADSKVAGVLGAGFTEAQNFGLGIDNHKRTGGYSVTLKNLRSSNGALSPLMRVGNAGSWQRSDGKIAQNPSQYSWGSGNSVVPASITLLNGTLEVKAVINRTQDLDLTSDVTLDGRARLELSYI